MDQDAHMSAGMRALQIHSPQLPPSKPPAHQLTRSNSKQYTDDANHEVMSITQANVAQDTRPSLERLQSSTAQFRDEAIRLAKEHNTQCYFFANPFGGPDPYRLLMKEVPFPNGTFPSSTDLPPITTESLQSLSLEDATQYHECYHPGEPVPENLRDIRLGIACALGFHDPRICTRHDAQMLDLA